MDKQKQIEEMARDIGYAFTEKDLSPDDAKRIAVTLYLLCYCKIDEDAVVLNREEQQKYAAYKIIEPQIRGCLDRERELEKRLETIRKETAEKFAKILKGHLKESYHNLYHAEYRKGMIPINLGTLIENIDEIAKELEGEK